MHVLISRERERECGSDYKGACPGPRVWVFEGRPRFNSNTSSFL